MNIIRINPKSDDLQRREFIFDGNFMLYSKRKSLENITAHANNLIVSAFGNDPEKAQYKMPLNEFVDIASALKTEFTNAAKTKELIKEILVEFGADITKTYFDVPRLRIVTSDNYLSSGVGYAYKAHRDTWYSSPSSQVNWWMPVYDLEHANTMSMYPGYWDKPLKNSSEVFDYATWCNEGRKLATTMVGGKDTRQHPLPVEAVEETTETRFVLASGEMLIFSAAQVHSTAPNSSGKTRFSIDFRTLHIDDLQQNKGAKNIDNKSTGTTLADFLRGKDFAKIDEQMIKS